MSMDGAPAAHAGAFMGGNMQFGQSGAVKLPRAELASGSEPPLDPPMPPGPPLDPVVPLDELDEPPLPLDEVPKVLPLLDPLLDDDPPLSALSCVPPELPHPAAHAATITTAGTSCRSALPRTLREVMVVPPAPATVLRSTLVFENIGSRQSGFYPASDVVAKAIRANRPFTSSARGTSPSHMLAP